MKEMRRILALVLCFVMLVGILPVGALATDIVPEETSVVETTEAPTNAAEGDEVADDIQDDDVEDDEVVPAEDTVTSAPDAADANAGIALASNEDDGVAPAAEGTSVVVIAASDYQLSNSGTIMTNIMNQIKADFGTAYGALLGGDYDAGSVNTKASHIVAVDNTISGVFPEIADENRVYIQGNHENYAGLKPSSSNLLTTEHVRDTEYYGVYAINHDDFPWSTSSNPAPSEALVQATADALGDYLEAKIAAGYTKPIFVMSHLPLHATTRGDNKYAKLIFDELEAAGEAGLNIIFLVGHNHSGGYDQYLGNGSFYLPEGSSLTVVKGSSGTYTDDSISFTYMNYGYLGKFSGSACTHQTMTAFEITDSQVTVKRYDTDSQHLLKAAGVDVSGYTTNANEYGYAVISLSDGNSTIYNLPADDTTTGGSNNSGSNGTTGGSGYTYELVTSIEAGEKYVIVGNDDAVALMDNNGSFGSQTVTISGTTLTSDVALTEWTISGTSGGTIVSDQSNGLSYSSSSFNLTGAADNTFNISAGNDDNFTILTVRANSGYSKYYFNYNGSSWESKPTSAAYVRLYKLTDTGSGGTVTPEGGDWVTISSGVGGTIYTLTDTLTAGKEYLIVSSNSAGNAYAMKNPGGSSNGTNMDASTVEILSGTTPTIKTDATDIVWTVTESGSVIKLINDGDYLEGKSGGVKIYTSSQYDDRGWEYESNQLKYTGGSNTYTVYYDDGYTYTHSSTSNKVYLFEKTGTEAAGDAEYAKMVEEDGTTDFTFTVSRGATDEQALATVMAGINVQTSANADGSNPTTLEDSNTDITWELASNYDSSVPGEYAVTISYKGVKLGTAKVIVPEVTITGISVSPTSGVVTVGASEAALVGATITVNVADGEGEDFTVPVTVGMLSGDFDTGVAGTYDDLTVSYNGFTVENFTLTVKEKVVNNYPSYPNEGAVKVEKTATGVDFQKTGVAKVELSASGVPMNQGVDVLLVLDTSSSMSMQGSLNSGTRIDVLKDCVNALITNLKEDRADGSSSNIDIAIVHFNGYTGNKNTNYIGSTARSTSTLGGQLTNGWVDIHTLSDTWADNNIPDDCSGTNYDHGLLQAYDLLSQKQADNGDNSRKQFVLFMSDGAPFQYNGVNSNSLSSDWEQWILGSYTQEQVEALSNVNNPEFYFGNNNGNGQKHRVAEAIKGAPANKYQIVTYSDTSSSGTTKLEEVSGLGATMYSVGLALEGTNMPTNVAGQEAILKTIASSEDVFYSVTSAAGLQEAFDDFAGAILYAAENAVFEDQLGASYNIQLANTTKRKVDDQVFTLNPAPTMEVREYTIWTRAELEDANGNLSEENAKKVGTRKTDENGDYIYDTLEVVIFNAAGTEAYTGGDTTKNIMVNNVICANTFWYNNGTTTVKVDVDGDGTDETDLAPETFIWKVGTIKSKEIALSYYVYLDDSLEGDASAGSYETNKYAILSYDNYLGNPCHKDTTSPQMAWLSANVSYAYYLVNEDGTPVNANGDEVTFANREIVVHPTKYEQEIKLNSLATLNNLEIASTGVLDEGNYALFDYGAKYKITVMSDSEGKWEITVGTDDAGNPLPLTTYVTDFSDTLAFTNDTLSETNDETGYDYTHTTVWFAVVWEPKALDDTVVIDYGLPVDVHVMTNDFFGDFGTLEGVKTGVVTDTDNNVLTNEVESTEDNGVFGSVEVIKPATGANDTNSVIRYTLNKSNGMQMNAPEVFTYSVDYTNTKLQTNNGFYYGTLTVIPATTVYYEDDFLTYTGSGTKWEPVNEISDEVITQDEDRPGDINFAFDTVIDANNVYGYDSAYTNCSQFSLDNAMKVHVDANSFATASFTFYGTGFDVIGLTSNTTGVIAVQVTAADDIVVNNETVHTFGTKVKSAMVNTYYGYTYTDGKWVATPDTANALYQVPVMQIEELPYGKYNVVITATYASSLDKTTAEGYDLYLDAIRIYDPTGNKDAVANDAYLKDNEAWPTYIELRNNIIDASTFENGVTEANGLIFIDGQSGQVSMDDYKSYGPNNELYLANNQAVAFNVAMTDTVADVQLGIKMANGSAVTYKISAVNDNSEVVKTETVEVSSATDMYYSILDYVKAGTVTIENVSGGILSLTNIKVTYTEAPTSDVAEANLLWMDGETAGIALMSLRRAPVVEEEEVPETTVPEETEPETTIPEETEPEETEPETEETKPSKPGKPDKEEKPNQNKPNQNKPSSVTQVVKTVVTVVKTVVNTVAKALSNLFGRWF